MVKNIVAGCVVVALIFMFLLAYAPGTSRVLPRALVKDASSVWIPQCPCNVASVSPRHWIKVKNRKHHAFARVQEAHSR